MARGKHPEIDQKDQLLIFIERTERLMNTRLSKSEAPYGFQFTWSTLRTTPTFTASSQESDSDDFLAYIGIFRQFFNQDEPINYFKIYNLLYQCLASEKLKEDLIR